MSCQVESALMYNYLQLRTSQMEQSSLVQIPDPYNFGIQYNGSFMPPSSRIICQAAMAKQSPDFPSHFEGFTVLLFSHISFLMHNLG